MMAFFVRPLTPNETRMFQIFNERYHDDLLVSRRLKIILLSSQRIKSSEIARKLEVTPSTIVHWIKRFNLQGLDCLVSNPVDSFSFIPSSQPLFAHTLTPTESQVIQQLLSHYKERSHTVKRLQCILLSSQCIPVAEVASTLGLSQKTARLWIKQFNLYGMHVLETATDQNWLIRHQGLVIDCE
jgi:transposase